MCRRREADFVDRLVVVAPRQTIVDQWVDSLKHACHLELKPFSAVERKGQDGVVTTYQSLTEDSLAVHRLMQQKRTLLVLDEVHYSRRLGCSSVHAQEFDGRVSSSGV